MINNLLDIEHNIIRDNYKFDMLDFIYDYYLN